MPIINTALPYYINDLINARKDANISQKDLAKRISITKWYLNMIERGRAGGKRAQEIRKDGQAQVELPLSTPQATLEHPLSTPRPFTHAQAQAQSQSQRKIELPPSPEDESLARRWFEFAGSVSRTVRYSPKWPDTIRQLRETDGIPLERLEAVLTFVQGDAFWRSNAASLPALRSRARNGLRKIENVFASMDRPGGDTPLASPAHRSKIVRF